MISIFEERDEVDEDEERHHYTVLLLMGFATLFFFVAGACMFGVTNTYYSPATDAVVETAPIAIYQPMGWIGIAFGFFCGYLEINKVWDILGYLYEQVG